jgi:dTDP-4-dehydrorhamnose reductase
LIEKSPIFGVSSNIIGVLNINEVCRKYGIKQIYFSTEAAYDGAKYLKYFETDAENPQSKYALTKVVADNIILNSDSQAWIFRTSWLYSLTSKSSFVTRILEKSKSSYTNIGVTDDLFGNPTPAWWLASTVINLLKDIENLPTGLYHLCSSRAVSKYDWAKRIITDLNPEKVSLIVPTKRNDFPNAHLRSPYVDLSTDKIQSYLGKSLIPTWEELWNESIK